ncbi:protein MRG1-like isoform X1 [Diospyros lotus]|uniref:protein MRG1-like isoform X1 n=1 Tax=Diospyros lotus TaxID=55363 RepID=UPI00225AA040|nr:protein MRG1-like isoform X1 [Diospyros lotus]
MATAVSDDSATISDNGAGGATTETNVDIKDAVESNPSSGPSHFSQGEEVLAFHNGIVYEAKVQKAEFLMNEWRYFVHYRGWNKNWDEWVGVHRLMKYTEENAQIKEELNEKKHIEKIAKHGRASQTKPRSSSVARGKKRKNDPLIEEKGTVPLEKPINIHIPSKLKKQLVDDCESVTNLGKLVKLPRSPNVSDILKKYLDYKLKNDGMVADSVKEIMNGLNCYFDKALPAMLLYNCEREQYQTIADNVSPSTVYGAEHLLRLFVKLPDILHHANIEEETLKELQEKLVDFLKFLQKNRSAFFLSAYQTREDSETSLKKQDDG